MVAKPFSTVTTLTEGNMPTCTTCHPATITAVQSASVVRELGFAGALSIAAASVLRIGHKRTVADAPGRSTTKSRPVQKHES